MHTFRCKTLENHLRKKLFLLESSFYTIKIFSFVVRHIIIKYLPQLDPLILNVFVVKPLDNDWNRNWSTHDNSLEVHVTHFCLWFLNTIYQNECIQFDGFHLLRNWIKWRKKKKHSKKCPTFLYYFPFIFLDVLCKFSP